MTDLLTTKEAADMLRLCPQSVRTLCDQKRLACIRHSPNGKRLIPRQSVETLRYLLHEASQEERAAFRNSLRKERSAIAETRRRSEKATASRLAKANSRDAIARSFRRNAEKQIRQKQIDQFAMGQTKLALKRHNSTCLDHAMPPVPAPQHRAIEVGAMFPFSGVYFAWDGLLCFYVGESVNVPSRVRNHNKFGQDTWVSFIETDQHKRYEHFYIWLLNPYENGGMV